MTASATECPPDRLSHVLAVVSGDDEEGLEAIEAALGDFPGDARLHFLRGSVLAALRRYGEGQEAMRRAVELAPDFAIARFQLGFLQFTSGEAAAAEETWAPLHRLDPKHPLRLFAEGLGCLARDEFDAAMERLKEGVALNTETAPLNRDMQLIMDKIVEGTAAKPDEPVSATHWLLQQQAPKTRH